MAPPFRHLPRSFGCEVQEPAADRVHAVRTPTSRGPTVGGHAGVFIH